MHRHSRRPRLRGEHDAVIFDEPGSLPRHARCPGGWRFWIVHPYVTNGGFQLVDTIVSCLESQLGEAMNRVADLLLDLLEAGRIAADVEGRWPVVVWHPNGSVETADGRRVRFAHCGGGFEPPEVVGRGTHLEPTVGVPRVALPDAPIPDATDARGWTFGYRQQFVDSDLQVIELRAATLEPDLDAALAGLAEWLGELVAEGLLAEPTDCLDAWVDFVIEPRQDHIAADARTPEEGSAA